MPVCNDCLVSVNRCPSAYSQSSQLNIEILSAGIWRSWIQLHSKIWALIQNSKTVDSDDPCTRLSTKSTDMPSTTRNRHRKFRSERVFADRLDTSLGRNSIHVQNGYRCGRLQSSCHRLNVCWDLMKHTQPSDQERVDFIGMRDHESDFNNLKDLDLSRYRRSNKCNSPARSTD